MVFLRKIKDKEGTSNHLSLQSFDIYNTFYVPLINIGKKKEGKKNYFHVQDTEKRMFLVFMSESACKEILQSDSLSEVYTYFKNAAMIQYIQGLVTGYYSHRRFVRHKKFCLPILYSFWVGTAHQLDNKPNSLTLALNK